MKMWLEQRRHSMLQLHLRDQQLCCQLRCVWYMIGFMVVEKIHRQRDPYTALLSSCKMHETCVTCSLEYFPIFYSEYGSLWKGIINAFKCRFRIHTWFCLQMPKCRTVLGHQQRSDVYKIQYIFCDYYIFRVVILLISRWHIFKMADEISRNFLSIFFRIVSLAKGSRVIVAVPKK